MKEKPILMSAPMVRAILAGTKTQTRRVAKPRSSIEPMSWECPYGQTGVDSRHRVGGDSLWVRETWAAPHAYDHLPPRLIPQDARIHYAATEGRGGLLWRPSIHMPRWASRITLEISDVRVEHLQDISEADAMAEGSPLTSGSYSHRGWYRELWDEINGTGSWATPWDTNPWVWVISFHRINETPDRAAA